MIEKIAAYMEQYHMVHPGDHISVGVSGGADSVCLFLVLERLRHRMKFSMSVVHIEHGIRGNDSLQDTMFVNRLADAYEIPFTCYPYKVIDIAKKQGLSIEEAGRNVRYEAFEKEEKRFASDTAKRGGRVKTAVAHHAEDNAETFLFHLCRGSGIDGLAGIRPVRGTIIRPLLCVTRREIEAFLEEEGQDYRIDITNEDNHYSRNRIRNQILPKLNEVNVQSVLHINQTAENMAELSEYIHEQVRQIMDSSVIKQENGEVCCQTEKIAHYPRMIKSQVMLEMMVLSAGSRKDITREHVNALLDISSGQVGRRVSLPYGRIGEKTYDALRIFPAEKKMEEEPIIFGVLSAKLQEEEMQGKIHTPYGEVCYRIFLNKKAMEIPKKKYTKWFDYDKIEDKLCFRNRMPGDYFTVDELFQKQKIKDYFINEKVSRDMRSKVVLVAEGHHILWAAGYRISEYYKIREDTTRILEIQFTEEGK